MKTKIKLPEADAKKLVVAAHYSEVKIGSRALVGKNIIAELNARDVNKFIELGRYLAEVTGNEAIIEEPVKEAPKATEQKATTKKA